MPPRAARYPTRSGGARPSGPPRGTGRVTRGRGGEGADGRAVLPRSKVPVEGSARRRLRDQCGGGWPTYGTRSMSAGEILSVGRSAGPTAPFARARARVPSVRGWIFVSFVARSASRNPTWRAYWSVRASMRTSFSARRKEKFSRSAQAPSRRRCDSPSRKRPVSKEWRKTHSANVPGRTEFFFRFCARARSESGRHRAGRQATLAPSKRAGQLNGHNRQVDSDSDEPRTTDRGWVNSNAVGTPRQAPAPAPVCTRVVDVRRDAWWGDLLTQFVENMTQPRATRSFSLRTPLLASPSHTLSLSFILVARASPVSSLPRVHLPCKRTAAPSLFLSLWHVHTSERSVVFLTDSACVFLFFSLGFLLLPSLPYIPSEKSPAMPLSLFLASPPFVTVHLAFARSLSLSLFLARSSSFCCCCCCCCCYIITTTGTPDSFTRTLAYEWPNERSCCNIYARARASMNARLHCT